MTAPFAHYNGQPVRARTEDTGIVIAPPRQGKTAYLAVGQVIDAPGAVVATSTKVDLLRLTAQPRAGLGRVHVFDPERVSNWPAPTRWNIVDGCADVRVAMARSKAMVAARPTEGTRNAGFFQEAADTVLRCLLHAADLGGHTMREVLAWARDFDDDTPYDILRDHPGAAPGWAAELTKFCRGEARETVSSTDMSLALVLKPLADPRVVDMVCPPPDPQAADEDAEDRCFDPRAFASSTDTLYLLSEGGASSSAPLITALVASVVHSARRVSQRTASGRIEPAMTFILDEVANIAPIPDLPALMSDGGGRGLTVWAVAQSPSQLKERYGTNGADSIFSAAAAKVLLGGCSDDRFLDSVSRLLGERRVQRAGRHYDKRGNKPTYNMTTERERVMPIDKLRTIPEGQGLLMYRDIAGAVVELTPWWKRPDAHAFEQSMAWSLAQEGLTPTDTAPTGRRGPRVRARLSRRLTSKGAA